MKLHEKIFYTLIGMTLMMSGTVLAIQVSVPSASTAGQALISTSTGNYVATTTDPFHVGSIYATTTGTSLADLLIRGLTTGCLTNTNGLVSSTGSSCGSGGGNSFSYPFTVTTFVSTTTPIQFTNGLGSYSTTTINGLKLSDLSPGFAGIGGLGQIYSVATSTIKTSQLTNDAGFLTSANAVTSVGLSLPAFITVTNSPVTTTGTLTGTINFAKNAIITADSAGTNLIATTSQLTVGSLLSTTTNQSEILGGLNVGTSSIGSFTQSQARVTIASTTTSQLELEGNVTDNHWNFRSIGGWLYISTSSPTLVATSTNSNLSISPTGTTTITGLNIQQATASSTSNVGFNITTGCFAISGVCIGSGSGNGTVTSVDFSVPTGFTIANNPITSSGTLALGVLFPSNAIIGANAAGTGLIATGTDPTKPLTVSAINATSSITNHFGLTCNGIGNIGGQGIETCGSDATVAGVLNTIQNTNSGGYAGLNLLNDKATTNGLTYAGEFFNGSNFSAIQGNAFGSANNENNLFAIQSTVGNISLQASTSATNASTSVSIYVGGNNLTNFVAKFTSLGLDIGTTTAFKFPLIISSSTLSQLALGAGNQDSIITMRNAGGNFYISTSSPTTNATSTTPLLTLLNNGDVGIYTAVPNKGGYTGRTMTITDTNTPVIEGVRLSSTANTLDFLFRGGNSSNASLGGFAVYSSTGATDGKVALQTSKANAAAVDRLTAIEDGRILIGTSTFANAVSTLLIASTTQSQLGLEGNNVDPIWNLRSIGGNFYIATSSGTGTATSTLPAITWLSNGFEGLGTTTPGSALSIGTIGGINISNTATSTWGSSANGINLTNGCFAIAGVCVAGSGTVTSVGLSLPAAFTVTNSPVTSAGTLTATLGFASNAILTASADGTNIIATTSQLTVGSLISTTTNNSFFTGALGVGTTTFTTAGARLAVASTTQSQIALISNPTDSIYKLRSSGGFFWISTSSPTSQATSSTAALEISPAVAGEVIYGFGTSTHATEATTIFTTVSAMPSLFIGSTTVPELMIDSVGNVGINDASPDFRLEAVGTSGNGLFGLTNTTDGDVMYVDSVGKTSIGTTTFNVSPARLIIASTSQAQISLQGDVGQSPTNLRAVGGAFYISTSSPTSLATSTLPALGFTSAGVIILGDYADCTGLTNALKSDAKLLTCEAVTSDERLKKDFTHLPSPKEDLKKLLSLPAYTFYYIDNNIDGYDTHDTSLQTGFKAQDVKKVYPELVKTEKPTKYTPNGTLVLNYEGLIPHLQNSIVGLQEEVDALGGGVKRDWKWWAIGFLAFWNILITGHLIKRKND